MNEQHFDVLIIGAGLSGIGTACHLRKKSPDRELAILERRDRIGGTWDLFRYPGIRSDSDMFSFGFNFRPWNGLKVLADGESIRNYIAETAKEFDVTEHIRFGVDLQEANWDSSRGHWTLRGKQDGKPVIYTCDVLISCTGYYDYRQGYLPEFAGIDRFQGRTIHPQQWPEDLDYADKKIVVIGSGATAVTLVPAMAEDAAHVTMLQRSPTYVLSVPAEDKVSAFLKRWLPEKWVYRMARKRNIKIHRWIFKAAKRWPAFTRRMMLRGVRKGLGKNFDLRHFSPDYKPWDQRLCAVPDGDLFQAINAGKASVVTDEIETFTEHGVRLKGGRELEADIIITATGLKVQVLGGMALKVDNQDVPLNRRLVYKGVLMEGVPNMAWIFGYSNAAWTLKADLSADYICRLLNHMQSSGKGIFMPIDREGCAEKESVMAALKSGYIARADHLLPRQGSKYPWRVLDDYEQDAKILLESPIEDGVLNFYQSVVAPSPAVDSKTPQACSS
ncbi:flavin-containing monooxygenase [Microbulbifer guangxiensis]|uniref:flavin-containing monooxygenase n=1 Tax=Microbulbifer guangxiensis TaxID=2904249 RepID=UPI001F1EFFE4|nr:NAD(P)/FAD-dependent oxidoreductase [Microbulbifer guangxiensis]